MGYIQQTELKIRSLTDETDRTNCFSAYFSDIYIYSNMIRMLKEYHVLLELSDRFVISIHE